jgi:sugar-specific transcriptional regulator TrmB
MNTIDLTPFGFTPTENLAYGALLEYGPSGGYALAKKLNIARANAYQALNGLVKKSAAVATEDKPQKYRPVRPEALLAHLSNTQAERLDLLEKQIKAVPSAGGESLVPIDNRRALVTVAIQTAARETGAIVCIGPADVLQAIAPAWRRREADGHQTDLWVVGEAADLPIESSGTITEERLAGLFPGQPFILAGSQAFVVAQINGDQASGYWVTDPIIGPLITATVAHLTD